MDQYQNTPQPGGYVPPPPRVFSIGKSELLFGCSLLFFTLLLTGSLFYHGLHLGFAVGAAGMILCSCRYLKKSGRGTDAYSRALLILSFLIVAAFPRSDDLTLKVLSLLALLTVPGLAFCLMTGKCTNPQRFSSLFAGQQAFFLCGFGQMGASARGFRAAASRSGKIGKTGSAVALGLLMAVPVVAILVGLLISADAAFEGLLKLLPEIKWQRTIVTLLFGLPLGYIFYTRTLSLHQLPAQNPPEKSRRGLPALTANTVLISAALVYLVYLGSQAAYFVGGFAGILPADYTLAEYARRGFFEMGRLCAINLLLVTLSVSLVSARGNVPGLTRILCLFLGLVTLFLVATASAKMLLYIRSFGLTRLRMLTEVFMLWLGAVTVFVCIWLFRPGAGYMKQSVGLALAFCAALLWCDVDTCVARYNVRAYQKGKLETVDMTHLDGLSDGAVPYIAELTQDSDPDIAGRARRILKSTATYFNYDTDLRGWNWTDRRAWAILKPYRVENSAPEEAAADKDIFQTVSDLIGIDITDSYIVQATDTHGGFHGDGETAVKFVLRNAAAANLEQMTANKAGWHDLPMPDEVQKLCNLFIDDKGNPLISSVPEGLYYFYDRHDQSTEPYDYRDVHGRASYNFTLIIYNKRAQMLYYLELDT